MRVRAIAATAIAVATLAGAQPAAAQAGSDTFGGFAALLEVAGQDVGQAMMGSESVFVYAHGSAGAQTAPEQGPGYAVQLTTSGPTATDAVGQREAAIVRMRGVAKTYGVDIEVADARVSLGDPMAVTMARMRAMNPMLQRSMPPGGPPDDATPAKPKFDASATLRFSRPPPDREAAFLDALHDAGADNISDASVAANGVSYQPGSEFLGLGTVGDADPKQWDAATANAVVAAHAEAALLAHTAGRELGEARQILLLSRSVVRGQATVLVAVRYGFAARP